MAGPQLSDASLIKTKVLPASNTSAPNSTDAWDLGGAQDKLGYFVAISVPAMTEHNSASYTLLFTLQDCATLAGGYTDVSPLCQLKVIGVASSGSLATTVQIALPPNVKRYIEFTQVVPTSTATLTAYTVTYTLRKIAVM